jgi:uncharacterized protein (TIGR02246 family)
MRITPMIAVAALGFTVACSPRDSSTTDTTAAAAAPVDEAAVRSEIEATNARGAAAINAADIPGWLTVYADDAVVMWPNGPATRGKADTEAAARALLAGATISGAAFTTEGVTVFGNDALETGTYVMTLTPKTGGSAINDKGKYMTHWKKQADGTWKIARDINNSDIPLPSG